MKLRQQLANQIGRFFFKNSKATCGKWWSIFDNYNLAKLPNLTFWLLSLIYSISIPNSDGVGWPPARMYR